jgi:hypothetical protein
MNQLDSVDPEEWLLRVIKSENRPKKVGDLDARRIFYFSGSRQGCSFTRVSKNPSVIDARDVARRSTDINGATIKGQAKNVVWKDQNFESYLDTIVTNAETGHVALRIKNSKTKIDIPNGSTKTPEEKLAQMNCIMHIKSFFEEDSDYQS